MFEHVAGENSFAVPADGMWQKIRFERSFFGGEPNLLFGLTIAKQKNGNPSIQRLKL